MLYRHLVLLVAVGALLVTGIFDNGCVTAGAVATDFSPTSFCPICVAKE